MKIKFIWYDLWIGIYYDKDKRIVYFCPIPCVCFIFKLKPKKVKKKHDK